MQTPPKQVLIRNIPNGPVRYRQPVVAIETVFQTPVKRQRVIQNVSVISPPKGNQLVNRRLVF